MKTIQIGKTIYQKASLAHATFYAPRFEQPQWSELNFESLAKEGHNANVWAYACINAIANSSATIPVLLYQTGGKERKEIESHPLLDLLKKPNEFQSGREFREEWGKFLLMSGRAFIELNGPTDRRITELWNHRPDRVAIVPDKMDLIARYQVRGDGGELSVPKEKMIYSRLFNPLDPLDGISPLTVAARSIDQDNTANAFNKTLLENGGNPPGIITTEKELNDNIFKRLQSALRQRFGGVKNAGKPLLLENGLKWQQTGMSPNDLQYGDMKKMNRVEICAAFNVPPEIIGDKEHATYSNYQEARASFYEETVIPFAEAFIDKLNAHLAPLFGQNLVLEIDRDSIDALSENADSKWTRVMLAVEKGVLTPNEAREQLGFSPHEKGNELYKPKPSGPGQNDAGTDDEGQDSGDDPKSLTGEKGSPFDHGVGLLLDAVKTFEDSIQVKAGDDDFFSRFEKERDPFYSASEKMIQKRFKAELKAILKAKDETELFATLKAQEKEWEELFAVLYTGAIEHFGVWNYERLKDEYDEKHGQGSYERKFFNRLFSVAKRNIQRFIRRSAALAIKHISETTRSTVKNVIDVGFEEGKTWRDIGRDIEKVYGDDFDARRSMKIARTEMVSASNYGAREGAKATGLDLEKTWVSTPDDRTRDTHVDCNGQTRDLDDLYDIGSAKGLFPGDPTLPAKERIHCRCAEKHTVKE